MFGYGLSNPYLYQPYFQTANMARNLGGVASAGVRNGIGSAIGSSAAGSGLASRLGSTSLGKGLFGKFSFSNFLSGASKTLNVVNQAIPIFYQVKPIINNAKTMFRIMGAVKDNPTENNNDNTSINIQNSNNTISNNTQSVNKSNNYSYQEENPTFFI